MTRIPAREVTRPVASTYRTKSGRRTSQVPLDLAFDDDDDELDTRKKRKRSSAPAPRPALVEAEGWEEGILPNQSEFEDDMDMHVDADDAQVARAVKPKKKARSRKPKNVNKPVSLSKDAAPDPSLVAAALGVDLNASCSDGGNISYFSCVLCSH